MSSVTSASDTQILNPPTGAVHWPRSQIAKLFVIGALLTITTNFPSAFTHTSVNTAFEHINDYLNDSYTQRGVELDDSHYAWLRSAIGSSWYAGQVIGAQFSPFVTDRFGRKPAYLLSTFMMTVACGLQSASTLLPYPELLIFGRIMASFFSPMSDAAAILYLQEIAPTHIRGVLSSMFTTFYSILGLLGMFMGTDGVLGHSLPLLLAVPVVPGILSLMLLIYLPETPKYLKIVRRKDDDALESLHFYQGVRSDNQHTLDSYAAEGKDDAVGNVLDLIRMPHLRHALIITAMCMMPVLAFYPILQSSTFILSRMDFEDQVPEFASSAMMVVLIICCMLAGICLDRMSRRGLVIYSSWGATISLGVLTLGGALTDISDLAKWVALAGMFGYVVFYGLGVGPISYFIGTELVPLQYRASMFSISFSLNNIAVVLTSLCVQPMYEAIGSYCFLFLFIIPNIIAIVYVHYNLPETKNREIGEIFATVRRQSMRDPAAVYSADIPSISSQMKFNGSA